MSLPPGVTALSLIFTSISTVARPSNLGNVVSYGAGTWYGNSFTNASSIFVTKLKHFCCATGTSCLSLFATIVWKSCNSVPKSFKYCLTWSFFAEAVLSTILFASFLTIFKDLLTLSSTPENFTPGTLKSSEIDSNAFCIWRISLQSIGSEFLNNARAFVTGFACKPAS